jgi:pyruvate carboxylase
VVIDAIVVSSGLPFCLIQAGHDSGSMVTSAAMKMEPGLHADRAATVKAVHVQPGAQIDAKDLLVELE